MTEQQMEAVEKLVADGVFPKGMLVFALMPNGAVHSALMMDPKTQERELFEHLRYVVTNTIDDLADEDEEDQGFNTT